MSSAAVQALEQELSKRRAHTAVLKKALLQEKSRCEQMEGTIRQLERQLRKSVEEHDSLQFNNDRLTRRVQQLQVELEENNMDKQSKGSMSQHTSSSSSGWFGWGTQASNPEVEAAVQRLSAEADVMREDLQLKIEENEQLHIEMFEFRKSMEMKEQSLQAKSLDLEGMMREKDSRIEQLETEIRELRQTLDSTQVQVETAVEEQQGMEKKMKSAKELAAKKIKAVILKMDQQKKHFEESWRRRVAIDDTKYANMHSLNIPFQGNRYSTWLSCISSLGPLVKTLSTQLGLVTSTWSQRQGLVQASPSKIESVSFRECSRILETVGMLLGQLDMAADVHKYEEVTACMASCISSLLSFLALFPSVTSQYSARMVAEGHGYSNPVVVAAYQVSSGCYGLANMLRILSSWGSVQQPPDQFCAVAHLEIQTFFKSLAAFLQSIASFASDEGKGAVVLPAIKLVDSRLVQAAQAAQNTVGKALAVVSEIASMESVGSSAGVVRGKEVRWTSTKHILCQFTSTQKLMKEVNVMLDHSPEPISNEEGLQLKNEIVEYKQQIEDLQNRVSSLQSETSEYRSQLQKSESEVQDKEDRCQALLQDTLQMQTENQKLQEENRKLHISKTVRETESTSTPESAEISAAAAAAWNCDNPEASSNFVGSSFAVLFDCMQRMECSVTEEFGSFTEFEAPGAVEYNLSSHEHDANGFQVLGTLLEYIEELERKLGVALANAFVSTQGSVAAGSNRSNHQMHDLQGFSRSRRGSVSSISSIDELKPGQSHNSQTNVIFQDLQTISTNAGDSSNYMNDSLSQSSNQSAPTLEQVQIDRPPSRAGGRRNSIENLLPNMIAVVQKSVVHAGVQADLLDAVDIYSFSKKSILQQSRLIVDGQPCEHAVMQGQRESALKKYYAQKMSKLEGSVAEHVKQLRRATKVAEAAELAKSEAEEQALHSQNELQRVKQQNDQLREDLETGRSSYEDQIQALSQHIYSLNEQLSASSAAGARSGSTAAKFGLSVRK